MILVDSSVWIDRFGGRTTLQTIAARRFIDQEQSLLVGDLILTEVLQGTRDESHFTSVARQLARFDPLTIVDGRVATEAARFYQRLRGIGVTVRKTIDTLIATRCVLDGIPLLYADRDFDPFVEHLGLRSALDLLPE